jgi:methylmalonyl-CoA/ethylmalonyl-CoA epimerase
MKFHHLGVATENIEFEVQRLRKLFPGLKNLKKCFDPLQDVELCLLELGGVKIELVSGEKVKNYIKRRVKVYHICFEVDNLERRIEDLVNAGCMLVSSPKPALLFGGRKVCFMITPMGFLIELLEV